MALWLFRSLAGAWSALQRLLKHGGHGLGMYLPGAVLPDMLAPRLSHVGEAFWVVENTQQPGCQTGHIPFADQYARATVLNKTRRPLTLHANGQQTAGHRLQVGHAESLGRGRQAERGASCK